MSLEADDLKLTLELAEEADSLTMPRFGVRFALRSAASAARFSSRARSVSASVNPGCASRSAMFTRGSRPLARPRPS